MVNFNETAASVDPFMAPSWRHEAIKSLASKGDCRTIKRRGVDPPLRKYASELCKKGEFASEASRAAAKIYSDDSEFRAEIEARILANETVECIASHTTLPESVIQEFEFLFFDVRRFSGATDWLLRNTVGFEKMSGFAVNDVRSFWCYQSLACGTFILDELIRSFKKNRQVSDAFTMAVYLKKNSDVWWELQRLVVNSLIPASGNGTLWLIYLGLENAAIQGIASDTSKATAVKTLRRRIIDCGRLVIKGKPLPPPPQWERRKLEEPCESPVDQLFNPADMLRESLELVSAMDCSEQSKIGRVGKPSTPQLEEVRACFAKVKVA